MQTTEPDDPADEERARDLAFRYSISVASARDIIRRAPSLVAEVFAQTPKDEPW